MCSTTAFETGLDKQLRAYNARSLNGDDQACSGIWQCHSRKPQCPLESPLQTQTPWPSSGARASGTAALV